MRLLSELNKRRVLPWIGGYLAGGFLALEGVDQLIGYSFLPQVVYPIVLIFYVFGVPSTVVLAWFHGEKGDQAWPKVEIWMHSILLTGALLSSVLLARSFEARSAPELDVLAAAGLDPRGVAVRYFEDFSGGELAYLADGLTEALIDELRSVRALNVISSNGVAQFRDPEIESDSVARALGVANLVAGSVEQVGDELRITTRIVEGLGGADVDRQTIRMPAQGFLAVQDSVVRVVALALRERLGEEVELRARQATTSVDEAWALVRRAVRLEQEANDRQVSGAFEEGLEVLRQADELLDQAAVADPGWVDALSERAVLHFLLARFTLDTRDVDGTDAYIGSGLEYANRALELDSRDATALEYRGRLVYLRWLLDLTADRAEADRMFAAARTDLEDATEVADNPASAYSALSHLRYQIGDNSGVVLAARRAYEEDAYLQDAATILNRLFWGYYDTEQIDEAQRWCDVGARRFPADVSFVRCQLWTMIYSSANDLSIDRAWELADELESKAGHDDHLFDRALGQTLVGGVIAWVGEADSATAVLERARLTPDVDPNFEIMGYEAAVRSVTGEHEEAISLLGRYLTANPGHSFRVGTAFHWWWRPLRDYPEFQALVDRRR